MSDSHRICAVGEVESDGDGAHAVPVPPYVLATLLLRTAPQLLKTRCCQWLLVLLEVDIVTRHTAAAACVHVVGDVASL